MVIGGVSSGKSTFVRFLASSFLTKNKKIAIIDADIGQSWIGPPTTIGAIILPGKEGGINLMRPDFLEFVGTLSPSNDMNGYLKAIGTIFEKVKKEDPFAIVVDTTGLIAGGEGLSLKLRKAQILSPTMIVAFKKNGEIDHILNALIENKFNVYVLPSPREVKERSMDKRRAYRQEVFRCYFEGSKILRVKTSEENIDTSTLVGILNSNMETLALGVVLGKEKDDLFLYTPLDNITEPVFIKKSSIKISLKGEEIS